MTIRDAEPLRHEDFLRHPPDFSLVIGGPLYQLLRRTHLADDALEMIRRRIVVAVLITWLPLLLLSAAGGQLWGSGVAVPFLLDVELHVRLLVALPLLIAAELVVHRRMRQLLQQFLERNMIPEAAMARFEAAIGSAFRLRNSVTAEVLLIAFVYGVGILVIWRHYVALDATTWYAIQSEGVTTPSLAGLWFGYVSLPIFQFLLARWYFRLFIWARFLWQVSRIELSLVPTHPDSLGGFGFITGQVYAFSVLAAAHGALLAGFLANRIFFAGGALTDFKGEIGVLVLFMMIVVFVPLLVFVPQLAEAKRKGKREYGVLAERYVRDFDTKWLRGGAQPGESLLGSGDIQSLADLGNSYSLVKGMNISPVNKEDVLRLAAATLAPILPLFLTMMSFEDLLRKLLGILF